MTSQYVMNDSWSSFEEFYRLLINEVGSGTIKIVWEGEKKRLWTFFNSYIKNSITINEIVQFKRILIQVVCEIIFLYEIQVLENIKTNNDDSKKAKSAIFVNRC